MAEKEEDENPQIKRTPDVKKWQTIKSFDNADRKEEAPKTNGNGNGNGDSEIKAALNEILEKEKDQKTIHELKELLEKEKEKSLRWHAKHDNLQKDLEKEIVNRINSHGEKIILDFLTVYEDFIRARDTYEKENPELCSNLNSIIKKNTIHFGKL